jgi:replicative DNA helicase
MESNRRSESRQQEITEISRSLKALAKELNVPVIALSQLSRASEQRTSDQRPRLSDLRESGAIEQDADMVLFLYKDKSRPDLDERRIMDHAAETVEVIIGKNRNGPTGKILLTWLGNFMRFEDFDPRLSPV